MIVFIGTGLFIGGLLSARYTVLALIPASALAISIAALAWAAHAGASDWGLLNLMAHIASLQIGYLCATGFRMFLAPMRRVPRGKPSEPKAVRSP
jgi:hypothetical protein